MANFTLPLNGKTNYGHSPWRGRCGKVTVPDLFYGVIQNVWQVYLHVVAIYFDEDEGSQNSVELEAWCSTSCRGSCCQMGQKMGCPVAILLTSGKGLWHLLTWVHFSTGWKNASPTLSICSTNIILSLVPIPIFLRCFCGDVSGL